MCVAGPKCEVRMEYAIGGECMKGTFLQKQDSLHIQTKGDHLHNLHFSHAQTKCINSHEDYEEHMNIQGRKMKNSTNWRPRNTKHSRKYVQAKIKPQKTKISAKNTKISKSHQNETKA